MLAFTTRGHGKRIVLVHGFTQTARSWDQISDRMPARQIQCVDLPGHGLSSDLRLDFKRTASALAELGPAIYIGYSLGGRLCLRLALDEPAAVRGLVLVSTTPGLADLSKRESRRRSDEELADRIEKDGLSAFLDEWLAQPMFASLGPEHLAYRRVNTADGIAFSLRSHGQGAMDPMWDELRPPDFPCLVVTGSRDSVYSQIGKRLASALAAPHKVIDGAGHACHLEDPTRFAIIVNEFISAI